MKSTAFNFDMANLIIEFKALVMKADTDNLHTIFFTQEEYPSRYHQDNIGLSIHSSAQVTKRMKGSNHLSWTRLQINKRMT